MRNSLFILSFLLLNALSAAAQDETRFYVKADPSEAAVGEQIEVSFILENGKNTGRFMPPDWEAAGFIVLGSNQSSSISIVNGQSSASASYNYTITPAEAGNLTIPSVSIKTAEGELHTEAITIKAIAGADGDRLATPKRSPATPAPQNDSKKGIKTIKM